MKYYLAERMNENGVIEVYCIISDQTKEELEKKNIKIIKEF